MGLNTSTHFQEQEHEEFQVQTFFCASRELNSKGNNKKKLKLKVKTCE